MKITNFKTDKTTGFFIEIPDNAFNFKLVMEIIEYKTIINNIQGINYLELPIERIDSENYELFGLTNSLSKRQKTNICDEDYDKKGYYTNYENNKTGYNLNINDSFKSLLIYLNLNPNKNYILIKEK